MARERITSRMIEKVCENINHKTGHTIEPYWHDEDDKIHGNPGTYLIDSAYGCVALRQMCEDGGTGERTIIPLCTKRELHEQMTAYLLGLYHAEELAKAAKA